MNSTGQSAPSGGANAKQNSCAAVDINAVANAIASAMVQAEFGQQAASSDKSEFARIRALTRQIDDGEFDRCSDTVFRAVVAELQSMKHHCAESGLEYLRASRLAHQYEQLAKQGESYERN